MAGLRLMSTVGVSFAVARKETSSANTLQLAVAPRTESNIVVGLRNCNELPIARLVIHSARRSLVLHRQPTIPLLATFSLQ